jgi:hypothetical protein
MAAFEFIKTSGCAPGYSLISVDKIANEWAGDFRQYYPVLCEIPTCSFTALKDLKIVVSMELPGAEEVSLTLDDKVVMNDAHVKSLPRAKAYTLPVHLLRLAALSAQFMLVKSEDGVEQPLKLIVSTLAASFMGTLTLLAVMALFAAILKMIRLLPIAVDPPDKGKTEALLWSSPQMFYANYF